MLRFLRYSSTVISLPRAFKSVNKCYSPKRIFTFDENSSLFNCRPFTNTRLFSEQAVQNDQIQDLQVPIQDQKNSKGYFGVGKEKLIKQILLFASCFLTFVTLIVGGQTRRMKAGLAMTSWSFFGEGFPRTEKEWELEFEEYKKIPEYTLSDQMMTLEEYKEIYFLEYLHRQLGRLTGVTIIATSLSLLLYRRPGDTARALIYGGLVCVQVLGIIYQGLLGWYMVKSGFDPSTMNSTEYPTVSPYRLTAHNFLGTILLALLLHRFYAGFTGLRVIELIKTNTLKLSRILCHNSLGLCMLTFLYGGLLSGTHAIYADPSAVSNSQDTGVSPLWNLEPKWRNLFENQVLIQNIHKGFAYGTAGLVIATAVTTISSLYRPLSRPGIIAGLCISFVLFQIHLGVTALNTQEMSTRMSHQITGLELVGLLILLSVELSRLKKGQYVVSNLKNSRITALKPPPAPNTKVS